MISWNYQLATTLNKDRLDSSQIYIYSALLRSDIELYTKPQIFTDRISAKAYINIGETIWKSQSTDKPVCDFYLDCNEKSLSSNRHYICMGMMSNLFVYGSLMVSIQLSNFPLKILFYLYVFMHTVLYYLSYRARG